MVPVTGTLSDSLDVFLFADSLHNFDSGAPVLTFDPRKSRGCVENVHRIFTPKVPNPFKGLSRANVSIFKDQLKVQVLHLSAFLNTINLSMQSACQLKRTFQRAVNGCKYIPILRFCKGQNIGKKSGKGTFCMINPRPVRIYYTPIKSTTENSLVFLADFPIKNSGGSCIFKDPPEF